MRRGLKLIEAEDFPRNDSQCLNEFPDEKGIETQRKKIDKAVVVMASE